MEISKDKGVTDERLKEQAGFAEATQRTPTREFKEKEEQKNAFSVAAEGAAAATAIPWNLRKRYRSSTPSKPLLGKDDPSKAIMQGTMAGKNAQRKDFSISLSRKEIEEDFYVFKGTKPNRKPKKRPKAVQKKLDALFPGFWLSEITEDMYKVAE